MPQNLLGTPVVVVISKNNVDVLRFWGVLSVSASLPADEHGLNFEH